MSVWSTAGGYLRILVRVAVNCIYGTMLHRVLARLLYFPTVLRLIVRSKSPNYRWYNRIDDTVILGALPFRSQSKQLIEGEKVGAVLSLNQPYELVLFTNSQEQWKRLGVRQFLFTTWDFQPPDLKSIQQGLSIIEEEKRKKNSVYVHCKAGKGRSAVLVTCYIMKRYRLPPLDAIDFLERKRPQISMNIHQRKVLTEYYEAHLEKKAN